jgi:predicted DNA-binding transcriptional regulator AlpA
MQEVLRLVPLSRSQIYRLEKEGCFVKRLRIGKRKIGFSSTDLARWLEEKREG